MRRLLILAALVSACKAPPEAPQGLDASARYMMRNFYADDATFQAGIQGYLDWFYNGGGDALVGLAPSEDTPVNAFEVTPLEPEDVAGLPLAEEIILEKNDPDDAEDDEVGPRDLSLAVGVVSVEEMGCSWKRAEELLAIPEQHVVFYRDWEAYQREYASPRKTFEDARKDDVYAPIAEAFDPHADDFEIGEMASSLMFTDNVADPAPAPLVGNLPAFPLRLEFRHGVYDLPDFGGEIGVNAIITYAPEAFWGEQGKNGMRQSYSVELNVETGDGEALRMLAIWNEPDILGIDPTNPIAMATAVNKSQNSSKDMREVCEGERELEF